MEYMGETATTKIIAEYKKDKIRYESFTKEMELLMTKLLRANKIQVKSINSRSKDIDSLNDKIIKKDSKYKKIDDITDLCGIRIITYYNDDVYNVEKIIRNNFLVDGINSIDKTKSLDYDRFGYMSLHYVVQLNKDRTQLEEYKNYKNMKFEIQIRSILQDAWAEIEHELSYKTGITLPSNIKRTFSRLSSLLETADISFQNLRNEINTYKKDAEQVINQESDIELNDITFKLLLSSEFYKKYLEEFINKLKETLNKDVEIAREVSSDKYRISDHNVKRLKYNSITTIEEVKINLKKYFNEMIKFVKLNDNESNTNDKIYISYDLPLFILNYAIIVNNTVKENFYEVIFNYFRETNISSNRNEEERKKWLDDIRNIFINGTE